MRTEEQTGFSPMPIWVLLAFIICLPLALTAQQKSLNHPQKREFRGVWVATVANIDFPESRTTNRIAIQEQYKLMLDRYEAMGFNAILFQVRPAGDAFYPSKLAPWSVYLTGQQGLAPEEGFDPLKFMVEETHKRGMEFHAWMNPYRATMNLDSSQLSLNHVLFQHPEWMVEYGRRYYLNPAMPEVRTHVVDVVAEVVENYDVDGIHFDDYFYPYPKKGEVYPDSLDFRFYGAFYNDIGNWRRDNVNKLVESVSAKIKELKPHVKFGISPFGVWRNRADDPFGSATRAGVTCFDDLYADVVHWMRNGWVDYIAPQLYWHIGFEPADYAILADWWAIQAGKCNLYIGHAAYKVMDNPEPAWHDGNEIPRQIFMNRNNSKILGSIYFSSRSILKNPTGLKDTLSTFYSTPAMLPETESLELRKQAPPNLRKIRRRGEDVRLKWKLAKGDADHPPFYYVIYRFETIIDQEMDFENPKNMLQMLPFGTNEKKYIFHDETAKEGKLYTYTVVAVNRQHAESDPSEKQRILKKDGRVKRIK
jgi:uncharacterized lipoprotein YddW (UPF0748 family)